MTDGAQFLPLPGGGVAGHRDRGLPVLRDRAAWGVPPIALRNDSDEKRVKTAQSRVRGIYALVEAGRNLRAEASVPSNRKARFVLRAEAAWIQDESPTISRLLNAESLEINPKIEPPSGLSLTAVSLGELSQVMGEGDRAAERQRLDKEIAKLEADLNLTEAKLASDSFVERAPKGVVEEHQQRREDFKRRLEQLRQARASPD